MEIYKIPGRFPKEERCALTSQIRRAAVNKENLKALKDDTKEVEGMLKALIKSFENKRLNQRGKGFGEELRQL